MFVLAVGQLAHLIVAEPKCSSVWIALGLFVALWWTWVGFAVLYNRQGADEPVQRLLFLAGSVPAGVAAVAIEPGVGGRQHGLRAEPRGHPAGAGRGARTPRRPTDLLGRRITRACLVSAALFASRRCRGRSGTCCGRSPSRSSPARCWPRTAGGERLRRDRTSRRWRRDPAEALDAHHFAERFGLFLIILLGEVVVEAGQASVDGHVATTAGWAALVAAMLLAGALWWLYFDSAAEINLRVLELSGGSPTMARAIFAVGHMLPAFALLITAAGVGLLLEEDPPRIAYWLACVGIGSTSPAPACS